MSKRNWDTDGPRLDEQRATAPDVPTRSLPKSTRRWCKGRVGREHVAGEPEPNHNYSYRMAHWKRTLCEVRPEWTVGWSWMRESWWCHHYVRCVNCRKILREDLGRDCPDYPGEDVVNEAIASYDRKRPQ